MGKYALAQPVFDHTKPDTAKVLDIIVNCIEDKKGNQITCLDLRDIEASISDYFVICHGNSTTQVEAIASHIDKELQKQLGLKPWHKEGANNLQWILMDYYDIVTHIFLQDTREFYNLEGLWADAKVTTY